MMDHEAPGGRRVDGNEALTIRLGAVLPLGIILAMVATAIHPHKEDVMDNPAVFTEYAQSGDWVGVHFAQWIGAHVLLAGLICVHHAIRTRSGLSTGLARLGALPRRCRQRR
jgi:hypothetical protein